jgi:hypothetical protein
VLRCLHYNRHHHHPPTLLSSPPSAAANDTLAAAQQVAAALLGGVTNVVLLENMLDAATIRHSDERQEVRGVGGFGWLRCSLELQLDSQGTAPAAACGLTSFVW